LKTECVGSQIGAGPSALRREQGLEEREAGGERGWEMPSMMWGEREDDNDLERGNERICNSLVIAERSFINRMYHGCRHFQRARAARKLGQRAHQGDVMYR
jgi:hypothetical protein